MFTNSDSFYYSLTYDITNSAQRQNGKAQGKERSPAWARADDRFFWNKYMIRDLLEEKNAMADQWIIPIIQGFVQMEEIHIHFSQYLEEENSLSDLSQDEELPGSSEPNFLLILISRRSRFRGGMRYKRRGVDSEGNVANYVETEQLIYRGDNILSFVQLRGSVPVFWSQQGYRYKPRPKLHRTGDQENRLAFKTHFEEQFKVYSREVIVNLMDHRGQEKLIGDAFLRQVELLNDPRIIYVSFDFHRQCQGRKFENVNILTEGISNIINDLSWFRLTEGVVMNWQEGVPRVNCMDCLDRTNLVQAAIARNVLERQMRTLRLLPRRATLPQDVQKIFQTVWANNGDTISKQYAGTNAMKSDFTRTGEHKFSSVMKDSYRSANRYYLHHFRHTYRQAVIDLMHGVKVTMDMQTLIGKEKPAKVLLKRESMSRQKEETEALIQACSFLLIPTSEEFLGGWLFINCMPSSGDASAQDLDVTFLLSNHACYFAYIDKESEITHHSRIGLEDIDKIEIGQQPIAMANAETFQMRLHYRSAGKRDCLFTLQTTLQCQQDSSRGTLRSIAKAVQKAKRDTTGLDLPVVVDNPHRSHISERLWGLLVSWVESLVAMVKSIIKACQQVLQKNRGLTEASPDVPELPARFTPTINVNAGLAECREGEVLYQIDQQSAKDPMLSIYLPAEGKRALPHPVVLLEKEDDSSDFWPDVSSSSSICSTCLNSDQEDHFLSSNSSSSSSSFLSEMDPTTMERFMLAHVGPNAGRLKADERSQAQCPPLAARFPGQDELPPIRGLGINTASRYSRNLQAQGLPSRLKLPARQSGPCYHRAGQPGRPAPPKRPSAQLSPEQEYSPSKGQSRSSRRARHTSVRLPSRHSAQVEEAKLASWNKQMNEILPPD
ncbi:phosphatidylinositide phosphatase SAC2-like isoform X2 [Scyliorhinus canicula]|uniref:phosphatidylinositide phosphatase SAC2-like isoform X2 n=1 Tax=Scyliorhinus canicula TaxID=7830 RepID=UPI0018F6B063|nr:phosphatidylinositide phosphatase SAC2-like isoform X2 [Scyliorhinus canicula]